ncbi:MAG TPA: XrtA system polysaccharide deacetylase [Verrucomicrobiae bacterium]|jgi:polysaccharide deacetylase family protein (PEP-CTERM system associated)|nr:XrtA system polysaccharide deacetylase [Verrucomicrobiae bacterium]
MKNALTFDVEEYFHAEAFAGVLGPEEWPTLESRVTRSTERLLDILDRERVRATFFVLGWVAERHPGLVREIASLGHEIACHGYGHRMIQHLSRPDFERDVTRAKRALEDAIGRPVLGYRAPTFSIMRATLWSLDVLVEAGFRYDSSIFPVVHDRYGIPDAPRFPHRLKAPSGAEITEFPMSTVTLLGRRLPVAGGGYFRLFPYRVTRRAIARINGERQPAMVYLHPWEIDPDQPRIPVGPLTRFRHLVNVGKTESRLRRLLAELSFAPAAEVLTETGLLAIGDIR